jgi:alpha-mannosidase II
MNRGVSFKGRSFFRQGDNPPSAPVQQQAVQQPVQPLQQQRPPPEQHETTAIKPKRANKQFVYRKLESELIDMRDMSATLAFEDKDGGVWKQGWDVIPKATSEAAPLKIFVVPHSHCDPGWIKTFDDYFRSQTSGIITSIVDALAKDPKRKFIWAEISYFEWWWREQSQEKQDLAKKLLRNGQLEFVTGGWVQPDEANTELYAMEVQLQEGHDWIRKNVGEEFIPKYGWSIDPFGYSPTMAYLLNKYGFEGMLIQRVHYAVKKELASKKQLEFMWRCVYF